MSDNKELSLPEIQQESLKVLIKFDSLCKEHNWSYFITFGTLLGAVRHKGFIPWDDDVDVQMPRKDFDEFSAWCRENAAQLKPFKLCSRETVENYPYGISRFANMNFKYVTTSKVYSQFDIGAFLDIYPFDNYGNDQESALKLYKKIARINRIFSIYMTGKCASGGIVKSIFKKMIHCLLRLTKPKDYPEKVNKEIVELVHKYTSESDVFIGCYTWYESCQFRKEWFAEKIELIFEGYKFPAPKEYDAFLSCYYGNYMELPPEEKRVPYHEYKIYRR